MADTWLYPDELTDDLKLSGLASGKVAEVLTCAWEYIRCVVPEFTNWERYLALCRLTIVGIVAEFRGELVDVISDRPILGYDLDELLDTLFGGTAVHDVMAREYRSFLLFTTEKARGETDSELLRRFVSALAYSPADYFRIRECDALARFYIAAAMACNDTTSDWPSDEEYRAVSEIADAMYDAVAYYKHRAEGEICNTFAYADPKLREQIYHGHREVLWALDATWARSPQRRCAINFARFFSGPIHMMMRRYRFVEDGLVVGKPETERVVNQTRRNVKLWYRIDVASDTSVADARYEAVMAQQERLLFPGFAEMLNRPDEDKCPQCRHRNSYGAEAIGRFGGVELCDPCKTDWHAYLVTFPTRAKKSLHLSPGRS